MDPRFSVKIYPRVDKVFTHKKSLNYDLVRSKIYIDRHKTKCIAFLEWCCYGLCGLFTGFTASIMEFLEGKLTSFKKDTADNLIGGSEDSMWTAWCFFALFSAALVLVASATTIFWGPGANGSGIAELIGYMNGVNYPNVFGLATYITKTFCVVLAVCGGLCVGKEGPLGHIGANCGMFVLYLPLPGIEFFRNDMNKRFLIAAGCSAGVSAAFGAPVGGTLFAYEVSKPNTFWKFSVIWKVFFACAISVFSLAIFNAAYAGEAIVDVNSSVLKFGVQNVTDPTLKVLPSSIICGAVCGVMGAGFIIVNSYMGFVRKKYIDVPWKKLGEAVFFSLATTFAFYWAPFIFEDCRTDVGVLDS